ncbi:hypothetical protein LPY66_13285 [Dehalobacter sp. DCM]|uniref:hypothetical protein n=1 Tax=Dehalobacter sp. DCM TaxID=2907827 RepID=UPI003081B0E6|nr:hypothetical protein LPY66_13285 [Dehalobacter sp. DCM]
MTMLFAAYFPGAVFAGGIGDVVTKIANDNYQSPEFEFGTEEVTGHGFKMHSGYGGYAKGYGGVSVLGPVESGEMSILLSYVDGEAQHTSIQTTRLKGCEVREYTMEDGVGVGVILPDYFITVEFYQSGNSSTADFQKAKTIAQQVLDALEDDGLLSQPAPEIEGLSEVKPAEEYPNEESVEESAPAAEPVVRGEPLDEPIPISNTDNIAGVSNGPTAPTTFTIDKPHLVTYIRNYHWNKGRGASLGQIGLKDQNGKVYGPWQASGTQGQGGVPNANWEVFPNIVIPAGTYTVTDSDPASWSANEESGGRGMGQVHATPHFEVTSGSLDELTEDIPGIVPIDNDFQESPAGVGSVGNIPGPSNTTEAVVGVAVPGLIATGLAALAGLGGGGGFTPPSGTPLSPNAGGPASGNGGTYPGSGTPETGRKTAGTVQEASQLGRRRRPELRVDTDEMGQGSITVSENDRIYVETADETGIFVQPEIRIDTDEMGQGSIAVSINDDIYVETADEAGAFIGTERLSTSSFADKGDPGILIDTSAFDDLDLSAEVTSESDIEAGTQTVASDTAAGTDSQIIEQGAGQKNGEEQTGIYDANGFDAEGYDRDGFNREGYDHEGYNREGFNAEGFDKDGFNAEGFDKAGYDREGFNQQGFDRTGFDREGYNQNGFDQEGFNRDGFDQGGYDREGFNQQGFDRTGFDREGYNQNGFDQEGFNRDGFDQGGYDREGFNQKGFDRTGFDREGYNQNGFDQEGFNRDGFDQGGYDREGFNQKGFDRTGFDREGYNQNGFDQEGFNRDGFDQTGYDREGFNQQGFDKTGFDREGFNREGFDKNGFDKEGFNKAGFDAEGFDKTGFNQDGFDREGYGRSGYNSEGFDREGFDVNGYNAKGYNRSGFNAEGYNAAGYDKEGFNKDGWDSEGYGRNGLNKEGFDREGYDKNGYDKDGYDREGFDREGRQQEGYDADGYDKKGFNKDGYDRDGYDREGFDFEGYNRAGYDPWGYNKQGYSKDGYHWSGYNADGYNRDGRHWSENPFEGDGNPFNVATQDPFGEGEVIPFGATWKPTKPALGEPYPRTLEKYGAKPWTDEPQVPVPEAPEATQTAAPEAMPGTDAGIGDVPQTPDDSTMPDSIPEADIPENGQDIPADQRVETGDSNTFTVTDPKTGETTTYEYEPGYTGPKHGQTQTLVGKTDGQTYELEFDAVKGKWINTESGNEFNPDDFERWQNDLSIDEKQAAKDLEKMANRQDANSKAIDKNLDDFKKLEKMQKAADKYNIGEPNGPGDVDKAIQKLKDDMLAGKELDLEQMNKIERVIDNRIMGKTAADTGERWEEDWFKNLGWALEANAATAKEVITGEKDDGSISWLGMGARIMITAATGGLAGAGSLAPVAIDGGLTVAEAMYRIKDSIDKGESDFKAVSKAIGLVILGEEMGWLAGKAGGKIMGEMLEKFPVFTNKAADFLEAALLKASAKNQVWSKALGLVSKESAEETLDQVNKRLVNIGSGEAAENIIKKARGDYGLSVADSFDDVSKAGKAVTGGGDEIFKGTGKSASDAGDNLAHSSSKNASGNSDDIAQSAGKAKSSSDDMARSSSTGNKSNTPEAPSKSTAPGQDGTVRTGDAGAGGPGDPGKPSSGGGEPNLPDDSVTGRPLNTNARTPEEVLADPAAISRAEHTVQNNIKDFDKLPPARQEELIREQAIYDEYKMQAQEKTYNLADKVERREGLTVDDIMEMKADPASMRTLKNIESTDGIGAELGPIRSRQVQSEFNEVLENKIHQPAYRDVESYLRNKLNTENVRCRTVRTPGTEVTPWGINTDNDVIAERLVNGPNGPEWMEIPKSEWQDRYNKAFAEHSGFSEQAAARRFPDRDWAGMDDAAKYKEWAELHEESAMDRFDPMAANDFSNQRTWMIEDGDLPGQLPGRNWVEASPEEIARGVDTVTIDGKQMRAASPYELAQRGEGNLVDSEQFGMMEKHKINDYWHKGSNPQEVMKNQTESLEQLQKTARAAQTVERSYRNMGYKVQSMPDNMQEAIKVINNNNLSPAARAARLQQLGYDTPGDFVEKVSSRIGAIRTAKR